MREMTFNEAIEALRHAVYGEEVREAIARALELSMNTQQSVAGKENVSNKVTSISSNSTDTQYPSAKATYNALSNKENVSNKVTSISSSSTNVQYPSAKSVYDALNGKENSSNKVTFMSSNSTDVQYPSAKAVYNSVVSKLRFDTTTEEVVYNDDNPYVVYLNAKVNNVKGIIITAEGNDFQCFFGRNGSIKVRYWSGGTSYSAWNDQNEKPSNKASSITNSNKTSLTGYPSIKAIVDYLIANYENLSNKLTSEDGIDEDSTDTEYPTAKAVFNFGADILEDVAGDLVRKESLSNKKNAIAGNETSEEYYPTTKAVYDYGSQISSAVEDVKAYIGYTSGDILGLHADFENNQFTRLGAAVGKNAGSDFDVFPMYGGRRRVVVDSNGVIDNSIAPATVTAADYDLDVMVYQPKFYYKVVPLKLEKQSSGLGYHIRKANYYITSTPHAGFRVHPLFIDKNGKEVDYVLFSAYEASYLHAESGNYSYFHDGVDTGTNIDWAHDVLKSLPGVKPISGQRKAMTKANMESLAQRKSADWHLDTIQSVSANQLLMAIEYASFNTQSAIGKGVVNNSDSGSNNCASLTGSTSAAAFNSASGMASETVLDVAGTETVNTVNGKLAVSYRGMENPWGNIFKHVNGVNVWGNGHMGGGQPYVCSDFAFNEVTHEGNYKPAGFSITNSSGYISAFGSGSEDFDWLMMPSEALGNSSLPVGDQIRTQTNNIYHKIYLLGGAWKGDTACGGFRIGCSDAAESSFQTVGGRLLFVPTATV